MAVRSVRLDEEAERILDEVMRESGLNVAEVLRRGLFPLREQLSETGASNPYQIYQSLDLGTGDQSTPR